MFAGMEMPRPVGDGLSGVAGEKQTLVAGFNQFERIG